MAQRDKNGRFIKGHGGFKKRTKFRKLQRKLHSNEDDLIQENIDLALNGDMQALRLCFMKLYGPGAMPDLKLKGNSAIEVSRNLLAAVGSVDAETLNSAAKLLESHIKIQESEDFERRLQALEDAK